jgi:hypothetical protein
MTTYNIKDFENPKIRDKVVEYYKKNPQKYFAECFEREFVLNEQNKQKQYEEWIRRPGNFKSPRGNNYQYFLRECEGLELHDENEIQKIWSDREEKINAECCKMLNSKVSSESFSFGYDKHALKYLFIQLEQQQKRIDELEQIISKLVHP